MSRLLVAAALAAAVAGGDPAAGRVDPARYDAFWLWAGVSPQPVLARARNLYLLRGQIGPPARGPGPAVMIAQGGATPHVRTSGTRVWIVFRAHTLDWPPATYDLVLAELARWRAAGDDVAGVQIDFDARTRRLGQYAVFLKDLRTRLPADCGLSITGLMDWGRQADPAALGALAGAVDEVVLQTYQGRSTLPDYPVYLARLGRFPIPFRIGLVEGGAWRAPPGLEANPNFRGYVVFLRNPPPPGARGDRRGGV